MSVFRNWEPALKQLVSAIDHYRDTLVTLETAFDKPNEYLPAIPNLDEVISNIYERRTFIKSKTDELCEANFRLDRIRNRLRKQVPINTLPPEILARIFVIACGSSCFTNSALSVFGHSIRETPQTLLALTQVCADWHRIMVNIPSFWSHIDIHRSRAGSDCMISNASLWLDRARNAPLSVHISSYSPQNTISRARLGLIFPRFSAATSLSIGPVKSTSWLIDILTLWTTSVKLGYLRSLTVLGSDGYVGDLKLRWKQQKIGEETLQAFFAPIRSLCLCDAYFDWDSTVYHGLVDLKISSMHYSLSITAGRMLAILGACPELRVLQLEGVNILFDLQPSFEPAHLSKLEVLEVAALSVGSLKQLLPIIAPGPGELTVRVHFQDVQEANQALQSFFDRSNVVRLFFHGPDSHQIDFTEHLPLLANLRVLLFDLSMELEPSHKEAKLNALIDALSHPNSTFPRHLRTLYLINNTIRADIAQKVVESCDIRKLRVLCSKEEDHGETSHWSELFTQDAKCQWGVNPKALVEDWYEHMWLI